MLPSQKLFVMRKCLFVLALGTLLFFNAAAQGLRTPPPSTAQSVKQEFALSSVELSYSRPSMRDRKIFGDLVPYGKVWRTGANAATTITFGEEVQIGGKKVPAGKYGLLTIPDEQEWTVIFSKQLDVTSPSAYKQDQDVVRVQAKPSQLPFNVETFTIMFDEVKPSSMDLLLLWDNVALPVPITVDVDTRVMGQINNLMN